MTLDQERAISASVSRVVEAWKEFNLEIVYFNSRVNDGEYVEAEVHRLKASAYFEAACDESISCHRLMAEAGAL